MSHPPSTQPRRHRGLTVAGAPVRPTRTWPWSAAIAVLVLAFVARRVMPDRPPALVAVFAVSLVALLMAGVVLHELGHLVAARWAGQRVLAIQFDILGGRTDIVGSSRGPGRDAVVAAAGPVVSVLLSGLAALVATLFEPSSLPWLLAMATAVVNGLLAVFNLLPALPLDGGEILRALLHAAGVRRVTAARTVLGGSMVVAGVLLAGAVVVGSGGSTAFAVVMAGVGIHLGLIALSAWRHERIDEQDDPGRPAVDGEPRPPLPRAGVLLPGEGPAEIAAALRRDPAVRWVRVDDEGEVVAEWTREQLTRILDDRGGAPLPPHDDRTT